MNCELYTTIGVIIQDYNTLGQLQQNQTLNVMTNSTGHKFLEIKDLKRSFSPISSMFFASEPSKNCTELVQHIDQLILSTQSILLQTDSNKEQLSAVAKQLNQAFERALFGIDQLEKTLQTSSTVLQKVKELETCIQGWKKEKGMDGTNASSSFIDHDWQQKTAQYTSNGNYFSDSFSQVCRVTNTASQLVQSLIGNLSNQAFNGVTQPAVCKAIATLNKPGMQLTTNIIDFYMTYLRNQGAIDFILISDFYKSATSITDQTLEDISSILKSHIQVQDRFNNQFIPFCIPVIVGENRFFEKKHIVGIFVTEKSIYYYDPLAISSTERTLKNHYSMRDVLETCAQVFTPNLLVPILENPHKHQHDIHSCGVLLLWYFSKVLMEEKSPDDWTCPLTSQAELNAFRLQIIEGIKTIQSDLEDELEETE